MTPPTLIAHRGYAAHYPENTLSALQAAVDAGARWLEIDVQLSADGVPVLFHDVDLQRTAGQPGRVLELPWRDLARIEVNEAARLGAKFNGVKIPTLAETVAWVWRQPQLRLLVEIKEESVEAFGARFVFERVKGVLGPALRQCVVISFDAGALAEARRLGCPEIGWVLHRHDAESRAQAQALAPDLLICNYKKVPETSAGLWPGPWRWALYEITEPDLALAWAGRGAAFIETMAIGEMLADSRLRVHD